MPEDLKTQAQSGTLSQGGKRRDVAAAMDDFRMVTFSLGRKAYGIDIMQVKEISSARRFTYVPNTANYVRGVFNLRGEIIPIIDMRLFFNLEITEECSKLDITGNNDICEDLIILTFGSINIGIIVDNISHVVGIDRNMVQSSHPLFSELDVPYIDGIVDYNEQLYIILAMDRIIDPNLDPSESAGFDFDATFARIARKQSRNLPLRHSVEYPSSQQEIGAPPGASSLASGSYPAPARRDMVTAPAVALNNSQEQAAATQIQQEPGRPAGTKDEHQNESVAEDDYSQQEIIAAESSAADHQDELVPDNFTGLTHGQVILAKALAREGFVVSPLNARVVERRWHEWRRSKSINVPDNEVLESLHNRKEFIQLLRSKDSQSYWSGTLQQALSRHFHNRSGNLNVWHAGCSNGRETYSLAASLVNAAPEANLQVRAADSDLLEVSEAPLQSVGAPSELPKWLREYLNEKRGNEGYGFKKELKDRIIFEYQDVIHSTPHTSADLIVVRDLLSRHAVADQKHVLQTISRSLKGDGLLVIGDNEELDPTEWLLVEREPLKIYRKKTEEVIEK